MAHLADRAFFADSPGIADTDDGGMTDLCGEGPGLLLDLSSNTDTDQASLLRLTRIASAVMSSAHIDLGCAVTLLHPKRNPDTTASSQRAAALALLEQDNGDGPSTQAIRGALPIVLNDVTTDYRWPAYQRRLRAGGCYGILAVPLQLSNGSRCALTLFAPDKDHFGPKTIARAAAFADVASGSLQLAFDVRAALTSAADLRTALEGRTSIDTACGVIMGQNRCSYAEAFAILASASSHRNIKVRKVAENILQALPGGPPLTHFDR